MIAVTESAAKDLVLQRIRARAVNRPTDLLILLDENLSYSDIQAALAELLYEGRIILTSQRELRMGMESLTGDKERDGTARTR